MIRTEAEYREALARLAAERKRLREQDKQLRAEGVAPASRKRLLDPQRSFSEQIAEEVASYGRLRDGDVGELENLHGLGRLLIALRIARGMTQRDLAEQLAVHETQVSRDERNEYQGVTVERASRIMDALKASVRTTVRRKGSPAGPAPVVRDASASTGFRCVAFPARLPVARRQRVRHTLRAQAGGVGTRFTAVPGKAGRAGCRCYRPPDLCRNSPPPDDVGA